MDIYESAARKLRAVLHAIPEPSMHETKTKEALLPCVLRVYGELLPKAGKVGKNPQKS